jgi:hypothetical protein
MNTPEPGQPKGTGPGLGAITDTAPPPAQITPLVAEAVRQERLELENERLKLENERLQSETLTIDQDRSERQKYAHRVFCLVVAWLFAMGLVVVAQGLDLGGFALSDAVVLTLIGSTTASVVGIFLIVAWYLFPSRTPPKLRDPRQG